MSTNQDRVVLLEWLRARPGWHLPNEAYYAVGKPRGLSYGQVAGDLRALAKTPGVVRKKHNGRWEYQAVQKTLPGSAELPFNPVVPLSRIPNISSLVANLAVHRGLSRIALVEFYLLAGQTIPEEAKVHGAWFGYCDSGGVQCPRADATHFGILADSAGGT